MKGSRRDGAGGGMGGVGGGMRNSGGVEGRGAKSPI